MPRQRVRTKRQSRKRNSKTCKQMRGGSDDCDLLGSCPGPNIPNIPEANNAPADRHVFNVAVYTSNTVNGKYKKFFNCLKCGCRFDAYDFWKYRTEIESRKMAIASKGVKLR